MSLNYCRSSVDFIPNTVVGGRMKNGNGAFLTCKYKMKKWVGEGVFTRITGGYKPHLQRDTTIELKKAIADSAFEFDNVPTSGFKFKGYALNYYSINEFNHRYNVLLTDPRGFDVAISSEEFFGILSLTGGNMRDFTIENFECVYAWNNVSSRTFLMSTSDPKYAKLKKQSEEDIAFKDNTKYITASKLEVGKCYEGSAFFKGKYVYCGKMDVLSDTARKIAIREQSYSIVDVLAKSSADETGKDKFVFYKLGENGDFHYSKPFVSRSGISKCFIHETTWNPRDYKMFDGSGDCTLENIMNALAESPIFNKIDFVKSFRDTELMPRDLFSGALDGYHYNASHDKANAFWPYGIWSAKDVCMSRAFGNIPVKIVESNSFASKHFKVMKVCKIDDGSDRYYSYAEKELKMCAHCIDTLYQLVLPASPVIYYTSGKKMPQRYAMFFVPSEYMHTRSYYGIRN